MEALSALECTGRNNTSPCVFGESLIQNPSGIRRSGYRPDPLISELLVLDPLGLIAHLHSVETALSQGSDDSSLTENIIGSMTRIVKENMYSIGSGSQSGDTCPFSRSPREEKLHCSLGGQKLRDESP